MERQFLEKLLDLQTRAQYTREKKACVKELVSLFSQNYKKKHWNEFKSALERAIKFLIALENCENNVFKRICEYFGESFAKISQFETEKRNQNENANDDDMAVAHEVFEVDKIILEISKLIDSDVVAHRINLCKFMKIIFTCIPMIDESVLQEVVFHLSKGLLDKENHVRVAACLFIAVGAVFEQDDVRRTLSYLISYDPERFVRIAALSALAPTQANTKVFYKAAFDPSPAVKKRVWSRILTDLPISNFNSEQLGAMSRHMMFGKSKKQYLGEILPQICKKITLTAFVRRFNLRNDEKHISNLLMDYFKHLSTKKKGQETLLHSLIDDFVKSEEWDKENNVVRKIDRASLLVWFNLYSVVYRTKLSRSVNRKNSFDGEDEEESSQETELLYMSDMIKPNFDKLVDLIKSFREQNGSSDGGARDEDLEESFILLVRFSDAFLAPEEQSVFIDTFEELLFDKIIFSRFRKAIPSLVERLTMFNLQKYDLNDRTIQSAIDDFFNEHIVEYLKRIEELTGDDDERVTIEWQLNVLEGFTGSPELVSFIPCVPTLQDFVYELVNKGLLHRASSMYEVIFKIIFVCGTQNVTLWEDYRWLPKMILDNNAISSISLMALQTLLDIACSMFMEDFGFHHCLSDEEKEFVFAEQDDDLTETLKSSLAFASYIEKFLVLAPEDQKQPDVVRHQPFRYRLFSVAVQGICKLILHQKIDTKVLLPQILQFYFTNRFLDDGLMDFIEVFFQRLALVYFEEYPDRVAPMIELADVIVIDLLSVSQQVSAKEFRFAKVESSLAQLFKSQCCEEWKQTFRSAKPNVRLNMSTLFGKLVSLLQLDYQEGWRFVVKLLSELPLNLVEDELLAEGEKRLEFVVSQLGDEPGRKGRRKASNDNDAANETFLQSGFASVRRADVAKLLNAVSDELATR